MQKLLPIPKISQLLFESKWFMTNEGRATFFAELSLVNPEAFYGDHIPTYQKETEEAFKKLSITSGINLTRNFTETDTPDNSIAYHRIFGIMLADEGWSWYFSTKQYVREILAADDNPQIIAHFIHINSPGGQAWYLDKAWEATKNLKKPVVTLYENVGCSAALYIGCAADKSYTLTQNDTIGSIGTKMEAWDFRPALEKAGYKFIEAFATKSDLKGKKDEDLRKGKPEQYIKEELDPLQKQFEDAVRASRESIAKLPEDHEALRGETFDGIRAKQIGLIDDILSFEEAVAVAHSLGIEHAGKTSAQNKALSLI